MSKAKIQIEFEYDPENYVSEELLDFIYNLISAEFKVISIQDLE